MEQKTPKEAPPHRRNAAEKHAIAKRYRHAPERKETRAERLEILRKRAVVERPWMTRARDRTITLKKALRAMICFENNVPNTGRQWKRLRRRLNRSA